MEHNRVCGVLVLGETLVFLGVMIQTEDDSCQECKNSQIIRERTTRTKYAEINV